MKDKSKTTIIVQDTHELKQVADRVGCIINLASGSYTFPTVVEVYGFSGFKELNFEQFKSMYL